MKEVRVLDKILAMYDDLDKKRIAKQEDEEIRLATRFNREIDIIKEIAKEIIQVAPDRATKGDFEIVTISGGRYVSWPILEFGGTSEHHKIILLSDGRFADKHYEEWGGSQIGFYNLDKHTERCDSNWLYGRKHKHNYEIKELRTKMIRLAAYDFDILVKDSWIIPGDKKPEKVKIIY